MKAKKNLSSKLFRDYQSMQAGKLRIAKVPMGTSRNNDVCV